MAWLDRLGGSADMLSTMITKWIEFTVAAESAEIFSSELAKMQTASRPEAGCVHYSVYRSNDDACLFTVLESWETSQHLEAHRHTAHMSAFKENCEHLIVVKAVKELAAIG